MHPIGQQIHTVVGGPHDECTVTIRLIAQEHDPVPHCDSPPLGDISDLGDAE